EVDPAVARRQKLNEQVYAIGQALHTYAVLTDRRWMVLDTKTGRWSFFPRVFEHMIELRFLSPELLKDPFDTTLKVEDLVEYDTSLTVDRLARDATLQRGRIVADRFFGFTSAEQAKYFKDGKWTFPETILQDMPIDIGLEAFWLKDAWGTPFRLERR